MRAVAEQLGDVVGVAVEVDPAVCRRCAETAPVDEDQAVLLRERPLLAERLLTPAEAAVHEGCRRKAAKNASTTSGANCVPRQRCTSAAASSADIDAR